MLVTLGGSLLVMVGQLEESGAVVDKQTLEFPFERLTPEEVSRALTTALVRLYGPPPPPEEPDETSDEV